MYNLQVIKSKSLKKMAILLILFYCTKVYSQQASPFNLPATIPVPEWVKLTNWKNPNVYKIDSLIAIYKNENKEAVKINAELDEEFHEDPYINAYIRWRNIMAPFIQENGSIKYDGGYHKQELFNSLDRQGHVSDSRGERTTAAANWTLLGPFETYRSGGTLRNYQTNIYCIAIAPSNPSVLYACSEPGTMYRSPDKGLHWVSVSDTLYSCGSKSIAINPLNENIVYTYDGGSSTLLKTINGGASWSALTAYTGGDGNAIAINRNTGRVFITGSTAIYYSDNTGASWTMATGSTVTGTLYDLVIGAVGTDTVYAVGSTSADLIVLLRSTDGGASFTNVTGAVTGTDTKGARLGVTAANHNYVYCINLGNTTPPELMKSTDRGATWGITATSTSTSLGGSSATTGLGMSNGQGYYDLGIVVSPSNANAVIVGTTTTYKSTDGGVNFSPLGGYSGPFALHPDIQQAVALGGDTYIATDGGVNYSTDFFTATTNWSVRNYGLRSADFWGFGQGWDEDIVVGGRYHNGNSAQYDLYGGGRALALGGGEDATGHVFHGNARTTGFRDIGTLILPTALTGPIQYSAANVPNSMWPQDDYYGMFSSELTVGPVYSSVFHLGKDSILWRSSNSGASYTALHNFGNGNKVWRFEISRNNPKVIYVCANNGLYKSTDAGTTWGTLTLPVAWSSYNTDVAINPLNDSQVYVCMANAGSANKVFRSVNGGATWTNITGATLAGKKVAFLQYHGGTNGGVYAVTNTRPSKVYYRDNTMSDWTDFSIGLPASLQARVGALIFYRDSKMRLAGNCSIWESPLYAAGAPVAQPMADKRYFGCARDTVNFYDYSMYDQAGASRLWSFPGALWVSSTSARTPKVVYPSAGYYTVSLQVTNAAAQTHTKTIDSMIIVADDYCSADTVAGKCLQMNGTSQTVNLGIADINSNNFSISCWIQPKGNQSSFSQIISHNTYPGSGSYGFGLGFKFNGYTPNLILCYTDSMVNYSGTSSLVCDSTRWNHVVLTYSPGGVVLYLNGIADTVNSAAMPVIDLSQSPFLANLDVHSGQGSKYNGKIDEVKIYNYALSKDEVREKMHLITDPATETGLIKYFQFNQYDAMNGNLYDVKANFNTFVSSANIVTSTAPVSSGRVYRNASVTGAGLNTFGAAGVDLHLPAGGTYPDGEVVAFHLFSGPDTKPDARNAVPGYFILNNYGNNTTFTQPDSTILKNLPVAYAGFTAGDFRLFKRASGDFGNTWSAELDSAATYNYIPGNSSLTWKANSYITNLNSQFVIVKNDSAHISNAGVVNPARDQWAISELYPNPGREWCRLNIHTPAGAVADANITITDISGRELLKISERLNKQDNTILLHLPAMAPGSYIVDIEIPGKTTEVRKLLIE
ncbi:MAG: putative glycoside hydrolase precursor [Flavipsychrobacter sp.]|jgi:hypothetical protein|nr:putative glycoside hydrolase precursor [Flavipsychrobacter sp.]